MTILVTMLGLTMVYAADVTYCEVDADCQAVLAYDLCQEVEGEVKKVCKHKPLFPMTSQEIVGSFVFALVMLLSNVGGIGGGGVAIPLVMVFFNFSMKPAIAISSFSIMCATLARFFFNFNEKHPEKPGCTSIDYGMTNVMMPLTMVGSLVGAYVYVAFPDLVLQIILTLLLFVLMLESGRKFIQTYRKESAAKAEGAAQQKEGEANGDQAEKTNALPEGNEKNGNGDNEGDVDSIRNEGEKNIIKEGGEPDNKVTVSGGLIVDKLFCSGGVHE